MSEGQSFKQIRAAQRWGMAGVLLAALTLFVLIWLITRIVAEGDARRDQTCEVFEDAHATEIEGLRDLYSFLVDSTPKERKSTLYRFVIAELPETEREARSDEDGLGPQVPSDCDDPGFGRPEPDPRVPVRPREVDKLVP